MPKTSVPAASEAVELLTKALSEGHAITLSLAAPPRVDRTSPLVAACCLTFGMTPSEARVVVALLEHGYVGREDLRTAMCDGKGASKLKTLDVIISRLRKKLKSHDIAVETIWGQGYKINENGRARVRAAASEAE